MDGRSVTNLAVAPFDLDMIKSSSQSPFDLNMLKSSSQAQTLQSTCSPGSFEDVVSAKCLEENSESQAGLLKLWWGLIQDQLSTLNREIESLRHANAQMEARQSQFVQFLSEQVAARQSQEEAIVEHIAKERASREEQISVSILEVKTELQTWVRAAFDEEFNQTKTLLARARQILDSDETLRSRLQSLLQTEMVSKSEFRQETQKLWTEVSIDRSRGSRAGSRAVSPSRTLISPLQAPVTLGSLRTPRTASCERAISPRRCIQTSPTLGGTFEIQSSPQLSIRTSPHLGGAFEIQTSPQLSMQTTPQIGGAFENAGRKLLLPSSTASTMQSPLAVTSAAAVSPGSSRGRWATPLSARSPMSEYQARSYATG
jgi:hypothetical protein